MKRVVFLSLILFISLAIVGPARATHFQEVTSYADCEGWSIEGGILFGALSTYVNIDYNVQLLEGTTVVEEYSETGLTVYDYAPTFMYGSAWTSELCGEYTVHIIAEMNAESGHYDMATFDTTFVCDCPPPPDVCTGTPGYWKNHPDAWPVGELEIGGMTYTKEYLLEVFGWSARGGNTLLKLFHHLVAAKLNILMGASYMGIEDAIDAADEYLYYNPLGSLIPKTDKGMLDDLKEPLEMFNESMPCGEMGEEEENELMLGAPPAENTEEKSWGAIKKIYE